MSKEQVVLVKSTLSRGTFPTECIFCVKSVRGGSLCGTAPLHYCYDANRRQLTAELPVGKELEGLITGLEVDREAGGGVRVYMPDGEVYEVTEESIQPVEGSGRVSVRS